MKIDQTNLKQNLEKIGEGISNKKNKLLKQKYNKKKAWNFYCFFNKIWELN